MASGIDLLIGTYSRLGGRGIVTATLVQDRLVFGDHHERIEDASFGVWSQEDVLYVVAEEPGGRVRVVRPCGTALEVSSDARSGGDAPCHLALDPAGQLLAAANYESGSVVLFVLDAEGDVPASPTSNVQLRGSGSNTERQAGPHAHWVGFTDEGRRLYCVDLGSDAILTFDVDRKAPSLGSPSVAYAAPSGSGPRHLVFHPTRPCAFLVSELASTLTMLAVSEDGSLAAVQTLSTSPADVGENLGGAIVLNGAGDRLYVTNRGLDSVAVFGFDGAALTFLDHVSSGGASPRFLLLLEAERRMLVANEEGGTVFVFVIEEDGRLTPIGSPASVPGAVFLAPGPLR